MAVGIKAPVAATSFSAVVAEVKRENTEEVMLLADQRVLAIGLEAVGAALEIGVVSSLRVIVPCAFFCGVGPHLCNEEVGVSSGPACKHIVVANLG